MSTASSVRVPLDLFPDKINFEVAIREAEERAIEWCAAGYKVFFLVDEYFFLKLGRNTVSDKITVLYQHNAIETLSKSDPSKSILVYSLEHSQDGIPIIAYLVKHKIKFAPIGCGRTGGYVYDDKICRYTIEDSYYNQTQAGYAKFEDPGASEDFVNLSQALNYTNHIDGDVVEVGCFRGSSGCNMLDYAHNKNLKPKTFYFFDVFEGFTYDAAYTSTDIVWANTHQTEGEEIIRKRLESKANQNRVIVKKMNIITDEFPSELKKIAVANLDVDLYEAVLVGLVRLANLMAVGGIMICEDAGHTPGLIGARLAAEQFIQSPQGKLFTPVHMTSGQIFLIRHS